MKVGLLAEYVPVLLALLLAILLTAILHLNGGGVVESAFAGGSLAVVLVWFAFFLLYRLTVFVHRGAPFQVGDTVQATAGECAGRLAKIVRVSDGSPTVVLKFEEELDGSDERCYDWNQVTKRRLKTSSKQTEET